ncbi:MULTISPECIES: conjugal transfer protein TraH [Enterobacterales]|jgi:conjugative transfer pilus assembly protein TraH|uniref:Conjugal transfer pilus assembly protein TraH n=5 Tax=Morganellaceae TaxID=1903414 RepID=A0A899NN37_PROST|nr:MULTISPECIES: conjugal transfer protein TraH [Enterobacterales]EKH6496408.1 conjugal transfer protein TraH [Providencia rettgeri]ELB1110351.1 conjugal transfer protein TraH [Morganella morganii]ELL8907357.1 conjugal transfer protein TraH [Proteus mirabilis]ELQ1457933.1 conjugal transfer protein TraH [Providencia rettgeri]ELR5042637.1 conjugal transfer protein TraH [Providencia rettgeri]
MVLQHQKSKGLKRTILAISIALSGVFTSSSNAADISTQLDSMFGSMSNVTGAGDYHSITRDGYTGGGFVLRNKLRTLTPVTIDLPAASGGCGGIDLFGGSFSFINAEQFVQMLRNIAANAAGLAFQLALNAMDAVLDNAISKMQAVVQQMNDLTVNSCQLAKGLLVDTASAFGENAKMSVSSQLSSDGVVDQFKAMWGNSGGGEAPEKVKGDTGKRKPCGDYGNLMWCLLQNGQFSSQFEGSEQQQKELVMSLTGTIIVGKDISTDKDGSIKKSVVRLGPLATSSVLDSIIHGDPAFHMWSCVNQTETCENPVQQQIGLNGVANTINKFFIDDGYLVSAKSGGEVSRERHEQAGYYNVGGAGNKAIILARHDLNASHSYIRAISPVLSYSAANQYLSDLLTAAATGARMAQSNDDSASAYYEEMYKLIEDARRNLAISYSTLAARYGGEEKIQETFQSYMQSLPLTEYQGEGSVDGAL